MTTTLISDYLGQGAAASRPAAPSVSAGALAIYYADDTGMLSVWDTATSAWVTVLIGLPLNAVGTGLTITSPGTVALDTPGAGLSVTGGTISAEWSGGTITALGAGLFATANTLEAEWNGGTVTALGANLSLTDGTLAAAGGGGSGGGEWTAGTVTAIGSGLVLSSDTLSATGGGGTTLPCFNITAGVPALSGFTQVGISGTTSIAQSATEKVISITDTGGNALDVRAITYPAPATPYRVAVLVCDTPGIGSGRGLIWGFSDGTKFSMAYRFNSGAQYLCDWSTPTSEAAAPNLGQGTMISPVWLGIRNDGTNLYWEVSADGVNFVAVSSVAVGSAFCTPTNVAVGLSPQSDTAGSAISIQCFDVNGLTRAFS